MKSAAMPISAHASPLKQAVGRRLLRQDLPSLRFMIEFWAAKVCQTRRVQCNGWYGDQGLRGVEWGDTRFFVP